MTIISQGPYWREKRFHGDWEDEYFILKTRRWYIYAGTVNDIVLFLELPVVTWIDLPLSLAADTIILPLTIYQQLQQDEAKEERELKEEERTLRTIPGASLLPREIAHGAGSRTPMRSHVPLKGRAPALPAIDIPPLIVAGDTRLEAASTPGRL